MFRAFLASNDRSLENIVRYTDRDLPVVNLRGEILFKSWSDIFQDNRYKNLTFIFQIFYEKQMEWQDLMYQHLESLCFPKREYCTALMVKMFSTALSGKWH